MSNLAKRKSSFKFYDPFDEFEKMRRSFFDNSFNMLLDRNMSEFKTDITDCGDSYLLETDLPGFSKDDIHLEVKGDSLIISAQRHSEHEDETKRDKYIRCERSYGSYMRQFDISSADVDKVKAKYENGVLKLDLPKKQDAIPKSRYIELE